MNQILHFDFAAIVACTILLIVLNAEHRKITTVRATILNAFILIVVFFATSGVFLLCDSSIFPPKADLVLTRTIITYFYYILHTSLWLTAFFYFYYLVRPYDRGDGTSDLIYVFPFIAVLVILFGNSVTGWIFTISEKGEYLRSNMAWVAYIADVYYFYVIIIILIRNRKEIGKYKLIASVTFLLTMIMGIVIQYMIPELQIEACMVTLATVILVMNVQNPREILDTETGVLNYGCFKEGIYKKINHGKSFDITYIYIGEIMDYRVIYEHKVYEEAVAAIAKELKNIRKNLAVYRINTEVFAIMYYKSEHKYMEQDKKRIMKGFAQKIYLNNGTVEMQVNPILLAMQYPQDVANMEDIMKAARTLKENYKYYDGELLTSDHDEFKKQSETKRLGEVVNRLSVAATIPISCDPIFYVADHTVAMAQLGIYLKDYVNQDMSYVQFLKSCGNNENLVPLETQLLELGCKMLVDKSPALRGAEKICLSLSNVHFMQDDMADSILRILRKYSISKNMVAIGITENVLHSMNFTIKSNIEKLRNRDIPVFLEGYGVGKSNFDNMTAVDYSFVQMAEDISKYLYDKPKYETVMKRQVEVVHHLGSKMLVSGIREKTQVRKLRELGVDYYRLNAGDI